MFSDDLVRPGKDRPVCRHPGADKAAAERFFTNDEIRRALTSFDIQLVCQHLGVGGGRGSYQGFLRGRHQQPVEGQSGQPVPVIFHELFDQQSHKRMQGDLSAGAISELLGLRNGAPIAAAVDKVMFRDPFCGDTKIMSGWAQVVSGDELHRGLRMIAFRELGNPRSQSVGQLLREHPELVAAITEAIFFRLVVLGDPDLSGNNFALEENGTVRNINVRIDVAFSKDAQVNLVAHPYFGNVMLRILEIISGSVLPLELRRKYTDFLFTYGSARTRTNLARFLEISPEAVDAMMERIGSVIMGGGGRFPDLPKPVSTMRVFDNVTTRELPSKHPDSVTPSGLLSRVKGLLGFKP